MSLHNSSLVIRINVSVKCTNYFITRTLPSSSLQISCNCLWTACLKNILCLVLNGLRVPRPLDMFCKVLFIRPYKLLLIDFTIPYCHFHSKMAASNIHYVVSSCRRIENSSDPNSNECQCYFTMKWAQVLERDEILGRNHQHITNRYKRSVQTKRLTSRQLHTWTVTRVAHDALILNIWNLNYKQPIVKLALWN